MWRRARESEHHPYISFVHRLFLFCLFASVVFLSLMVYPSGIFLRWCALCTVHRRTQLYFALSHESSCTNKRSINDTTPNTAGPSPPS
mmetsp:Transcript_50418/g.129887  ORF Transcript_50418/g.129887 Transcript_50418/m.129887 type:complete len:88 (+) Transcript_50418:459-722(+)